MQSMIQVMDAAIGMHMLTSGMNRQIVSRYLSALTKARSTKFDFDSWAILNKEQPTVRNGVS